MDTNAVPTEQAAVVATVDPDALTATTHDSDWVDMADFEQIMCVVMAGTLGSSATFDAKLQEATDSSGTGAQDITGKAITQLTQASPDDSDKQAIINLRASEMDLADSYRYVRVRITVAAATSDGGAVIFGFNPKHAPAYDHDLASVAEIVN